MPPEKNPQQDIARNPPAPAAVRKPAIRTMRSDAEELFKTTKPSLMQMIGAPQDAAPRRESSRRKSVAIFAAVAGLLLLLGGGGWWYITRGANPTGAAQTTKTNPRATPRTAHHPLFATESSRTVTVKKQDRAAFLRLMQDTWKEQEREGTVKRIILMLQDGPQEYPATLADFFELWRIRPPASLAGRMDQNLMIFMYQGRTGNRLGLAARTREPERAFADMLSWEPSILVSITPLFFDERAEALAVPFEDRTYRNIDWRYLKLSQEKDLGIGYAVFPVGNIFILTAGKEPMETVINRLFDAR